MSVAGSTAEVGAQISNFSAPPRKLLGGSSTARTRSFLAVPGSEQINKPLLITVLGLIALTEGADAALFPNVSKRLEQLDFDLNNLGTLSVVQALFQAVGGPFWGIMATRVVLTRKTILIIGTVLQGLFTILMCFTLDPILMGFYRAVNGFCLAALRPIANSIIGDCFDDKERGRYFGVLLLTMNGGGGFFGIFATAMATIKNPDGIDGWQIPFIVVGALTIAMGPIVWCFLTAPPVVPDPEAEKEGVMGEFKTLCKLFKMWTFAALVIQGCFGMIPWRAFEFRTFFFQTVGIPDVSAATLNSVGLFTQAFGNFAGGNIGDFLSNSFSQIHGRILCAEISVYGGIPIAFFTFMVMPEDEGARFMYYLIFVIALGLIGTWPASGTNSPILCSIADERERSLVLAWQTSLEGAIGAVGGLAFVTLSSAFGYDQNCAKSPPPPECSGDSQVRAAGLSLFLCSCVPWVFCGIFYTTLHCSYPRDLESVWKEREAKEETQLTSMIL